MIKCITVPGQVPQQLITIVDRLTTYLNASIEETFKGNPLEATLEAYKIPITPAQKAELNQFKRQREEINKEYDEKKIDVPTKFARLNAVNASETVVQGELERYLTNSSNKLAEDVKLVEQRQIAYDKAILSNFVNEAEKIVNHNNYKICKIIKIN